MVRALALALALAACAKAESQQAASGSGSALTSAWTKAGLTVSALTDDKSGAIGKTCKSGTVSGVDVVHCTFDDEAAAKAAEAKGLEWVGAATGTALVRGKALLAVVDRRNADPSGRTINAITRAFR
jgi:hypothetical protein